MQQVSRGAEAAWITLMRVTPALVGRVERVLKKAGLPPLAWYDVLWELERAGHSVRQRDLARGLLLARYSISRLLDRLENEGLIERQECVGDARGQMLKLTRAGRSLRARMWPTYAAAIGATIDDKLTRSETLLLVRLLDKLR